MHAFWEIESLTIWPRSFVHLYLVSILTTVNSHHIYFPGIGLTLVKRMKKAGSNMFLASPAR